MNARDIMDAFESRLKSKISGSIFLAFIAVNWRVIFYVCFSNVDVEARFTYFDDHTDLKSLFALPILIGLALSFLLPWLTVVGMWMSAVPENVQRGIRNKNNAFDKKDKLRHEREIAEEEAKIAEQKANKDKLELVSAEAKQKTEEIVDNSDVSEPIAVPDYDEIMLSKMTAEELQESIAKADKQIYVELTNIEIFDDDIHQNFLTLGDIDNELKTLSATKDENSFAKKEFLKLRVNRQKLIDDNEDLESQKKLTASYIDFIKKQEIKLYKEFDRRYPNPT